MARPLRIEYPGALYHVMNRGANKQSLFFEDRDRWLFMRTLQDTLRLYKFSLHAYALMGNHYHLLIETPLGNLSHGMQHLDGRYAQRFNFKQGRDGPLLRGRYKSKLVEKEHYFLELIRYIHLNSVRAGLVKSPEEDPFCSHYYYLHSHKKPSWLTTQTGLKLMHPDPKQAPAVLHQFVLQGLVSPLVPELDNPRWPAILGSNSFIEQIKKRFLNTKEPHPEKPQEKIYQYKIKPRKILRVIKNYYGLRLRELLQAHPSYLKEPIHEARRMAIYLLRHEGLLTYAHIGMWMSLKRSQISRICSDKGMKERKGYLEIQEKMQGGRGKGG